mmetsp:Transcript_8329/g.25036  ORF Transcript_8329/g.25036 Transcript_8329/m.25036 type:complete len:205 (-) Transcript_8329:930-1544(-)
MSGRGAPAGKAPEKQAVLVLIKGFPGVGKTTFAEALSRAAGFALICKDDVRDFSAKLETHPDFPSTLSTNAMCYEIMWRVAERQLIAGLSTIVESPLGREELYETGVALAERLGVGHVVIECRLKPEVWQNRLEERRARQSLGAEEDHKPTDTTRILQYYAGHDFPILKSGHFVVDCSESTDKSVVDVISWLSALDLKSANHAL